MAEYPKTTTSTPGSPAIPDNRSTAISRGWRETVALFTLLTPQEARLLLLIAGLLLLGLSVRFVHLRQEQSRVLPVEARTDQPVRSPAP